MTSDVVLTAALRNNLLSLQNTQSAINTTQYRLSTGRKVNSALDNPQNFFASQALNNRASDLTRLLDGIGQSIQVIKAADNGTTALTDLVNQADTIANSARDALAQGQAEAKITGSTDLSGTVDLTPANGQIVAGDQLVFTVTKEDGSSIQIASDVNGALGATATITIGANDGINDLINNINSIQLSNEDAAPTATGGQAFEASLDSSGNLQIKTLNGGNFNLQFASVAATDAGDLSLASALGFDGQARVVGTGAANANNVEISSVSDVALRSFALTYTDANGQEQTALRSTTLDNVNESSTGAAAAAFAGLNAAADDLTVAVNGGTQQTIDLTTAAGAALTIQDVVDQINTNTALNTKIQASFDESTGQIQIKAIDASVQDIQLGVTATVSANLGFGVAALDGTGGAADTENIRLAAAAADLASYESDYNRIRDQITELVTNGDTGYKGTNLLNGDNLTTYFNEYRTSSLTTNGQTYTADGLGIDAANFSRTDTVDTALDQTRSALDSIRSFGSSLASDLSVIQTRETFTQNTINTLQEGSDKLTVADQNEEGAKLLALQTRQQLGVTSLALASQSQQSILRLF